MAKKPSNNGSIATEEHQLELIDTEHPQDKALRRLALAVRRHDTERSEAQEKADEARKKIRDLMHEHKIARWVKGDFDITLKPAEEKVSVKKRKGDSETTEPGDDDDDVGI